MTRIATHPGRRSISTETNYASRAAAVSERIVAAGAVC